MKDFRRDPGTEGPYRLPWFLEVEVDGWLPTAWMPITPKGGPFCTPIHRRGNRHLRTWFVQGARAVLFRHKSWTKYSFGRWLTDAARRLHKNVLAIALANKLAGIAWAVLYRGSCYEPEFVAKAV